GVEQLEDVGGDGPRSVLEDRVSLLDALAANVVHDEPRLARGGPHVPGARANDEVALGPRSALTLSGRGGLRRTAPALLGLVLSSFFLSDFLAVRLRRLRRLRHVLRRSLLLGGRRRGGPRLRDVVVGQARDQLGLIAALGEAAGLELGLELVDLQRLPAALRRRIDLVGRHRIFTLSLPAWPRNIRVGANSPSLWPTIDSEMNTGTCLRPSWTAIVWPTISGKIVDIRDQVLIICLLPPSFICWIRAIRRSSTNGPFLVERPIGAYLFFFPRRRPR